MQRSLLTLGLFFAFGTTLTFAQAGATASRAADLQLGVNFTYANSDYVPNYIRGYGLYAALDVSEHWGGEFDFHQLNDPSPGASTPTQVYERTYEIGARYAYHFGKFHPYAKAMVGRGVFNFPQSAGNLAYNMVTLGGGVDVNVHRIINVRADFEYQDWFSGPGLHDGLSPMLFTIGVAYHFPAGDPRK